MSLVVAITGARGFVGSVAIHALSDAGHDVIPIGRDVHGRLARLDERDDRGLFDGAQVVVHLAAQLVVSPEMSVTSYLEANVALTESVTMSAIEAGATRIVLASSRLVYPSDLGRPATERDAAPDNAYGLSKWFAERVVEYQTHRSPGVTSTALRLSQLFGSHDVNRGVLARFAAAARAGHKITVEGRGVAVRDFLEVDEAARAITLAVDHPSPAPVYNIGGGGMSIRELAHAAAEAFGRPPTSVVHRSTAAEDESYWALDTTLATDHLGWSPRRSMVEAIRVRNPDEAA